MLRAMIDRANYRGLFEQAQDQLENAPHSQQGQNKPALAELPMEVQRFGLDMHFDRPIQAQVRDLLVADAAPSECILLHGMGGSGKTVTAVAVMQEKAVRERFMEMHWVTVGGDVIGENVKQLQAILYQRLVREQQR